MLPCMTATRAMAMDWWVSPRGGRITIQELFAFQGFRPESYKKWSKLGITDRQIAKMLGNSMSVCVIERVLVEALWAAGLVTEKPVDRWAPRNTAYE
eukprot:8938826-Pyramimonas_sp.AAC.1